jgi:hypothetical protein
MVFQKVRIVIIYYILFLQTQENKVFQDNFILKKYQLDNFSVKYTFKTCLNTVSGTATTTNTKFTIIR